MNRDKIQAVLFCVVVGVILAALIYKADKKQNARMANTNSANFQQVAGTRIWSQQPAPYNPSYAVQAALTQGPAIAAGQDAPELIKPMGIEVIEISGGKLKITGVMGASWADKAGLQAKDILLRFNNKKIESLAGFKEMVTAAPPEKDYSVKYLRNGALKKTMVTIGEGEMEGFLPIKTVAFGNALGQGVGRGGYGGRGMCVYRCPQCGVSAQGQARGGGAAEPVCGRCRMQMQRIL